MIKLGILETGQNRPQFIKQYGTMGDWFIRFLSRNDGSYSFKIFKACFGEIPSSHDQCSAYLITGSAHSVYEKISWLNRLSCFIRKAAEKVPFVGICFGHQLLHQIFGGKIALSVQGWGIGVHQYEVFKHRKWMFPPVSRCSLLASHKDQVIKPAENSIVLAGSEFCPVAVSTIGSRILTIQPHPEMCKELAMKLYELRRKEQGDELTDWALSTITQKIDDCIMTEWITNFLRSRLEPSREKII